MPPRISVMPGPFSTWDAIMTRRGVTRLSTAVLISFSRSCRDMAATLSAGICTEEAAETEGAAGVDGSEGEAAAAAGAGAVSVPEEAEAPSRSDFSISKSFS